MSNQAVFDAALNHIRNQRCQSLDENGGSCAYRGAEGRSCAFAPCIKIYKSFMDTETRLAGELISKFHHYLHEWAQDCSVELGNDVQCAHDGASADNFMESFEERMESVARRHELQYTSE